MIKNIDLFQSARERWKIALCLDYQHRAFAKAVLKNKVLIMNLSYIRALFTFLNIVRCNLVGFQIHIDGCCPLPTTTKYFFVKLLMSAKAIHKNRLTRETSSRRGYYFIRSSFRHRDEEQDR